ncbi:MAG: right-handed parallel beta-helix repeat-containing protein [Chthoniobacteraceae bacterium]
MNGPWTRAAAASSASVLAKAVDGDVIHLKPGTYTGGFVITHALHLIGETGEGQTAATIQSSRQDDVGITAQNVVLEKLVLSVATADNSGTLRVSENGSATLKECTINTQSKFGALVVDHASLTADSSVFSTAGQGSAFQVEDEATATVTGCEFTQTEWGYTNYGSSTGTLTNCKFSSCGTAKGDGSTITVSGAKASTTVAQCQFTDNPAGMVITEGSTVTVSGSTFQNSGITGELGNSSSGVVDVKNQARATFSGSAFTSNREGLAVEAGGQLALSDCQLTGNGLQTDNQSLLFYTQTISVSGAGSTVSIKKSTIAKAVRTALNIVDGSSATIEDTEVTDGLGVGLALGNENAPASHATVARSQFKGNASPGIEVSYGSSLEMSDSASDGNSATGIEVSGRGTKITLTNTSASGNQSVGLLTYDGASASASTSNFQSNQYGVQAGLPEGSGHGGSIALTQSRVTNNSDSGVIADSGGRVTLHGCLVNQNGQNYYRMRNGVIQDDAQADSNSSNDDAPASSNRKRSSSDDSDSHADRVKKTIQYYLHRFGP